MLGKIWADQGYAGAEFTEEVAHTSGIILEIVERPAGSHTFTALPRRWVVERSLAWLGRDRRLSKDYERYPATTEGIIWLSEMSRLLKRATSVA
jgi:putative transposase